MALLTPQDVDTDGISIVTAAASAGGDTFANPQERYQFYVVNSSGVQRTVTITSTGLCNQGFSHDTVQAIEDGETWTFGPFDRERFNDASGLVSVTYSSEVGLAVAVLHDIKPPAR